MDRYGSTDCWSSLKERAPRVRDVDQGRGAAEAARIWKLEQEFRDVWVICPGAGTATCRGAGRGHVVSPAPAAQLPPAFGGRLDYQNGWNVTVPPTVSKCSGFRARVGSGRRSSRRRGDVEPAPAVPDATPASAPSVTPPRPPIATDGPPKNDAWRPPDAPGRGRPMRTPGSSETKLQPGVYCRVREGVGSTRDRSWAGGATAQPVDATAGRPLVRVAVSPPR
jgi:hypothetical protein